MSEHTSTIAPIAVDPTTASWIQRAAGALYQILGALTEQVRLDCTASPMPDEVLVTLQLPGDVLPDGDKGFFMVSLEDLEQAAPLYADAGWPGVLEMSQRIELRGQRLEATFPFLRERRLTAERLVNELLGPIYSELHQAAWQCLGRGMTEEGVRRILQQIWSLWLSSLISTPPQSTNGGSPNGHAAAVQAPPASTPETPPEPGGVPSADEHPPIQLREIEAGVWTPEPAAPQEVIASSEPEAPEAPEPEAPEAPPAEQIEPPEAPEAEAADQPTTTDATQATDSAVSMGRRRPTQPTKPASSARKKTTRPTAARKKKTKGK